MLCINQGIRLEDCPNQQQLSKTLDQDHSLIHDLQSKMEHIIYLDKHSTKKVRYSLDTQGAFIAK